MSVSRKSAYAPLVANSMRIVAAASRINRFLFMEPPPLAPSHAGMMVATYLRKKGKYQIMSLTLECGRPARIRRASRPAAFAPPAVGRGRPTGAGEMPIGANLDLRR